MKNLEIKFKNQKSSYSIIIGKNTLNILPSKIKIICPKVKNIAIIYDKKVPLKFKENLKNKLKNYNLLFLSFDANEKNKSLKEGDLLFECTIIKKF